MDELIARLEAAPEGNADLDGEISEIEWRQAGSPDVKHIGGGLMVSSRQSMEFQAPRYTTSLDAALTLVPEGMYWFVDSDFRTSSPQAGVSRMDDEEYIFGAKASTPALALSAAGLKARAAMEKEGADND